MFSPRVGGGGGGATHGKLTQPAFPCVGILTVERCPWVGNLTWPPSWKTDERTKGKQICFIFPYILVIASFSPVLVFLRVQKFALQMMPSSGTVVLVLL